MEHSYLVLVVTYAKQFERFLSDIPQTTNLMLTVSTNFTKRRIDLEAFTCQRLSFNTYLRM